MLRFHRRTEAAESDQRETMKLISFLTACIAISVLAIGCGGDTIKNSELESLKQDSRDYAALKVQVDQLQSDLQDTKQQLAAARLKADSSGSSFSGSTGSPSGVDIPPYREDCGNGVYAASTTSCGFALNVASAYRASPSSTLYNIYSSETNKYYDLSWSGSSPVTCTGGIRALIYIK